MKKIKYLYISIFYLIALQFQFLFGTTALMNPLFKVAKTIIHKSNIAPWFEKKIYSINVISSETKFQEVFHNFFYITIHNNKITKYSVFGKKVYQNTKESLESKINWPHVILGALVADRALNIVNNTIDNAFKHALNKTKNFLNQPCKSEKDYFFI